MSELKCESVCMAAMAMADGYEPTLSRDKIESHLAGCAGCRGEVGQLRAVMKLLDAQERGPRTEQVWNGVNDRLGERRQLTNGHSFGWSPFLLMGSLLLCFKVVELAPRWNAGMLFRLLPVLIAATVFVYIRENPFKVSRELKMEGD